MPKDTNTASRDVPDYEENHMLETQPVDFYHIDDLLTEKERAVRDHVRKFCDQEVIPIAGEYWERAEMPFELLTKIAALNIVGGTIQGYGCPGLSPTAAGLAVAEFTRGDGSLYTSLFVHTDLAMAAIHMFGSEEQKERWLPPLARLEKIAAFALTEPEHGSDVVFCETNARRERNQWVINGSKKWIGNAPIADVIVVWAQRQDGRLGAFLVEKDTPGLHIQLITGKVSQRIVQQGLITLDNVHVSLENLLIQANSFGDCSKILTNARCSVAWGALGHAMACYEYALAYTKKRVQFGKTLVHFQLVQQKLARMLAEVTCIQLLCLRLSQLMQSGDLTAGMPALAKMQACLKARQIAADARDLLGSNGILLEYHVAKHQADIEGVFTGEGTDHTQALIIGKEITNIQAFI